MKDFIPRKVKCTWKWGETKLLLFTPKSGEYESIFTHIFILVELKPPTSDEIVQPFFQTWNSEEKHNCWWPTNSAKRICLLIRRTGSEQSEQRVVTPLFLSLDFRYVTCRFLKVEDVHWRQKCFSFTLSREVCLLISYLRISEGRRPTRYGAWYFSVQMCTYVYSYWFEYVFLFIYTWYVYICLLMDTWWRWRER